MKKLPVLSMVLVIAACSQPSKLDEKTNIAVLNVMAATNDVAKCTPTFQNATTHAARCTLPNGAKVYCTAGQLGWQCSGLVDAPPTQPQPQAAAQPPAPPPTPAPQPAPAPQPHPGPQAPKK